MNNNNPYNNNGSNTYNTGSATPPSTRTP
jgi:hypothetical protein